MGQITDLFIFRLWECPHCLTTVSIRLRVWMIRPRLRSIGTQEIFKISLKVFD